MNMGLLIKNGPNKGAHYPLNDTHPVAGTNFAINDGITTIGRGIESDIQVNDAKVSRQHCQIIKDKNNYLIRDLNSRNHIKINEKVITETTLHVGDEITLGDTILVFSPRTNIPDDKKFQKTDGNLNEILHSSTVKIALKDHEAVFDTKIIKEDFAKYKKAHESLLTLYKVGNIINSIRNMRELFSSILEVLFEVVNPDRCVLMTYDEETKEMVPQAVKRKNEPVKEDEKLPISRTLIAYITKNKEAILSSDAMDDTRFRGKESIAKLSIRSIMCAPITSKERLIGLIYVDCDQATHQFEDHDLQLLLAIAGQAGIAIENSKLFEDLHSLFLDTIKTLVAMIDAKDQYTRGHSERVCAISLLIADELNINKIEKETLRLAAILHDIGKIWIPEEILNKASTLTAEELENIRKHPETGAKIIGNIKNLEEVVYGVRHHHERFDGKGYPDGLSGKQIPLMARILCVADSFDAMISNRPYRDAHGREKAISELKNGSGTQFDPEIVEAFLKAAKKASFIFSEFDIGESESKKS